MRKLFLLLSLGVFLFSCKEVKKETKPSPYQALADQYAEFPLTTDLNQLTENEKKMIPILIEVADIMEDIFWQNAYGDKSTLMAQFAQDSAALKYLSIIQERIFRLYIHKLFRRKAFQERHKLFLLLIRVHYTKKTV